MSRMPEQVNKSGLMLYRNALLVGLLLLAACGGAAERASVQQADTTNATKKTAGDVPAQSLAARADSAVAALAREDWPALAALVHPTHGVRFTPYAYVDTTRDVVFSREHVARLDADTTVYHWGAYDGTGEPITLTFAGYYERFIYNKPYRKARRGAPNERLGRGNALHNIASAYEGRDQAFVEYHAPGSDKYDGMDWGSLRLVFEREAETWYLVGIVHEEWTI